MPVQGNVSPTPSELRIDRRQRVCLEIGGDRDRFLGAAYHHMPARSRLIRTK
jgi:hypothetical protein